MLAQAQGYRRDGLRVVLTVQGMVNNALMKAFFENKMPNPDKVFAPEAGVEPLCKRLRIMASPQASRAPLAPRSLKEDDFAPPPSMLDSGPPGLAEEDAAPLALTEPTTADKDTKLDGLIDGIRSIARMENKDCEAVVKDMIKNRAVMASVGCTEEELNDALLSIQDIEGAEEEEAAYTKVLEEAGITQTDAVANKQDMKPEQNIQARKRQGENSQ